jgi:hypothetical protein
MAGIKVPLIKITNKNADNLTKPIILILGRQNPGETYSSYLIHTLIN